MNAKLFTLNLDACADPRVAAMFEALGVPEHLRPGARPWIIGTKLDEYIDCLRCKGTSKLALVGGGEADCPTCNSDGHVWRRFPVLVDDPPLIGGGELRLSREQVVWRPWLAGYLFGDFDYDRAFATRAEAENRFMVLSAEEEQEWQAQWRGVAQGTEPTP